MLLRKKPFSLNGHVLALVFAAMIPTFAFSAVIMSWLVVKERANSERALQQAAQDLALSFDQEITSSIRSLQILTTSTSLLKGDLPKFQRRLKMALSTQPNWSSISLSGPNMDLLLSTSEPYGKNLGPSPDPASLEEVFRTGKPVVSSVMEVAPSENKIGGHAFSVRIPVVINGRMQYALSAMISTSVLQKLMLQSVSSPAEVARGLIDPQGIIAARSALPEKFVGKHVSPCFGDFLRDKIGQELQKSVFDGNPVYSAGFRAPVSGWAAAVSIQMKTVEAQANRAFHLLTLIGIVLLIVSGVAAAFFSRRLSNMIKSAAKAAAALARGEAPNMAPSGVTEVEQLRESLCSTSDLLISRERLLSEHLIHSNSARAEAEKANRAKSEFLANMSHELRTPLGIVLGITDLVAKDMITPEEREKNLEIMRRNGERLLRLINDILDLEKVEAQKLTMENIEFSFPDLISEIITDFESAAKTKGLELIVTTQGAVPRIVISDPVRLRQVIDNLLSNAIKFTEKGSIEVNLKADGGAIEITVKDSGIGLTAEQQSCLFVPFTQGDSSHTRKYGGTGLGLALSKRIAQALGGDVTLIESIQNKGSVFKIDLKLRVGKRSDVASISGKIEPARPGSLVGRNILLAEDSPDNAALFVMYLKHAGANVDVAENGLEAVNKVRTKSYDLVLMDIQMPVMDGFKATKELRMQGFTLPIIALTAHALNDQKEKAFDTGFTGYVTKPIQPNQLLQVLERHLGPVDPPRQAPGPIQNPSAQM